MGTWFVRSSVSSSASSLSKASSIASDIISLWWRKKIECHDDEYLSIKTSWRIMCCRTRKRVQKMVRKKQSKWQRKNHERETPFYGIVWYKKQGKKNLINLKGKQEDICNLTVISICADCFWKSCMIFNCFAGAICYKNISKNCTKKKWCKKNVQKIIIRRTHIFVKVRVHIEKSKSLKINTTKNCHLSC